ncbi:MAG: histidinol-phosphate transaminase [Planctomycetia bacterium]|nr:histidinol-phosphate transaminase [Planctomycetia bacterium]
MKYSLRKNILDMPGYIPGEQPHGGNFIKLNTNECPYPPSERVLAACVSAVKTLNRYPDPLANGFRNAASEIFDLPHDWFLTGNGSDDLLTILTRAFVGEGDILRLPYPSYILYKSLAQLQNANSQEVLFTEDWRLSPEFARTMPNLKLVYLPNPNSPSGTCISREEILRLAHSLPCPLVVDEAYADFAPFHCMDLVRESQNLIVLRTMSKSYALAGLRFGFLAARPEIIHQLIKVKDSYNCDALSISAATAAIQDRDWFSQTRQKILKTREVMFHELQTLGFQVTPSDANFLWCTLPDRSVKPLYEKLKSENIFVRYMVYPDWAPGHGEGLRISVGTDSEIAHLLRRIAELL